MSAAPLPDVAEHAKALAQFPYLRTCFVLDRPVLVCVGGTVSANTSEALFRVLHALPVAPAINKNP